MLLCVAFENVERLCGKRNFKRRRKVQFLCAFFHHFATAGRLEQLSLNMQTQSVCSRSEFSCVINFRLEQVITPRWLSSEVVVCPACKMTTTSMLRLWCGWHSVLRW